MFIPDESRGFFLYNDYMFDSLQEKLTKTFRNIQGKGKLSEKNMEDTLKEIRIALLESDVNYGVVKEFLEKVRLESIGQDVLNSVEPGQLLVKIVHDEIVKLLFKVNQEQKTTVIMVTHDTALVRKYPHRTINIVDGCIDSDGEYVEVDEDEGNN